MPQWVADHDLWEKAKKRIREEYPSVEADSDQFWRLTTGVYKKMGGAVLRAVFGLPGRQRAANTRVVVKAEGGRYRIRLKRRTEP